ncbi:AAA family ATPase [Aestuariirhabdus litorea]|uniref:MoxR family ATPase n=1 Tax=Aestuariirhabdus litorea TaxID=2528527 RepID=A0A3P3VPY7_9GAMM|nr:MoxR family ATPase [Aestuariirhabdus litorea]RRJ84851.1 MoxR family ATPase [Aestuariirhabdus litorea]RWW98078.1 MoxR family ATPase [Endozoicomonadaceae bacterium GTF-13]
MSHREAIHNLELFLSEIILGQQHLVNRLLIALLADGHLLVEGAPGLAKTRAIKGLAQGVDAQFHRIQFTPDLLPADITGTDIFRPETASFEFQRGPIFHNLVLADEINRAPAKVQSALLEAMAERQVSVGSTTYPLPPLFLVMATQNPIEQEGTYPLPEAQLDRFLMHVKIGYPDAETEQRILAIARRDAQAGTDPLPPERVSQEQILQARQEVLAIHMAPAVEQYLVNLVLATRSPSHYDEELASWIEYGASPRGTIALDRCARARAWLSGRDFVTPDDVQAVAYDTLRHRIILSYSAQAQQIDNDRFIERLIACVPVA